MNLDYAVALRQDFNKSFNPSAVAALLEGRLRMTPHPEWLLPDNIDWTADPFDDVNWVSQFHMLRWLEPLRSAGGQGNAAAFDMWIQYTRHWVDNNPRHDPSHSRAWSDMVDGIRAINLCLAAPIVRDRSPSDLPWLRNAIQEHADHLSDPCVIGKANHALHQHEALFVCGRILGHAAYTELATSRLSQLLSDEYDSQGINAEGAIAYHYNNYLWYERALRRFDAEGVERPPAADRHALAPVALAHATRPDGALVTIGDTDRSSVEKVRSPYTQYVTSAGAEGEPPEDLVQIYESGYLFARSGWGGFERDFADETFFSVSFGAANRVHGHPDGGSMTFSSMGHEWVTDPGKYQYGRSPMRTFCAQRPSHSLVAVEGRPYARNTVVECDSRRIDENIVDVRFRDSGYEGVQLKRRIVYSRSGEYAVVIDSISADSSCTAIQNWQCAAGVEATTTSRGFRLTAQDSHAFILYSGTQPELSIAAGQDEPLAGWVSTGWKSRAAAPALGMRKSGTSFRFITVIAAGYRSAVPTMETVRGAPAGEVRLRIDTGRVAEQIVVTPHGSRVTEFAEMPGDEVSAEQGVARDPIDPTSASVRRRVLRATRRARRTAWDDSADPEVRTREAAVISKLAASYDLQRGPDLGLQSTLADLREVTSTVRAGERTVRRERPGMVAWGSDAELKGGVPTRSVYGTTGPLPPFIQETQLTYVLGSLVLPVMVCPAPGDTLTVMFHGALDRARIRLPMYQRLRFQASLGTGPVVAVADPTLDLARDLRLGWYLGTEELDLHASIASAIRGLTKALGARHVILQGGSGGGFAALQVGTRIAGSHVVAMNPQTDLRRYSARFTRAAMTAAFGQPEISDDSPLLPRVSVLRRIEESSPRLSMTLVMNSGDLFHEKHHAQPLRKLTAKHSHIDLEDVAVDLGAGHRGLDNDQYRDVMMPEYARIRASRSSTAT